MIISDLADKNRDNDCYILTCGPSLNNYTTEYLEEKLAGKTVIAVKQAIDKYPKADYHCWNCCNLPHPVSDIHYPYTKSIPVVVASSNFAQGLKWSNKQHVDIFCKIPDPSVDGWEFLVFTKDYDRWTFKNSPDKRPCGPSIMYETVLFLAYHIGAKTITTIGWDLQDKPKLKHFYDGGKRPPLYNPGYTLPWEVEATVKATKDVYFWLRNNGVELRCNEDSDNDLYHEIERIKI